MVMTEDPVAVAGTAPPLDSKTELLVHMYETYHTLRLGLAILAFALPLILFFGGGPLRSSMSAYYHHEYMRNWFVGILWAAAVGLGWYKGFSRSENVALNLSGLFAIGVAMVPVDDNAPRFLGMTLHAAFAVAFFLPLAYVAIFCGPKTVRLYRYKYVPWYERAYRTLGTLMIALPLTAAVLVKQDVRTFYVEWAAIYVFATYWAVKSWEMRDETRRERNQLKAMPLV
jgi:hypothetical protein